MSSNAGPDIVQDGLVFKYDTGDGKSYKGEPTTNVVSQPFNLSSGYSKGTGMETASGTTLNFTGDIMHPQLHDQVQMYQTGSHTQVLLKVKHLECSLLRHGI